MGWIQPTGHNLPTVSPQSRLWIHSSHHTVQWKCSPPSAMGRLWVQWSSFSAYLTRSAGNSDTPELSLLKYFLHLPSGILDLPVFLLPLPHPCSVLLSYLPSSNSFHSTRMALCSALQYFSTHLSYQLTHFVISASLKALRTVHTLPNYIIRPGFSRRIPSHIPMVSIFVSPKYKCWNLNPQRWWF